MTKQLLFELWCLFQANPTVSGQLLSLAHKLGVPDADRWCAATLVQAQRLASPGSTPTDAQVLQAAQLVALGQQITTTDARSVLSIQDIRRLATAHSQTPAPVVRPPTASSEPLRSAAQVQVAFNNPKHWTVDSAGQHAPRQKDLQGQSQAAWDRVQDKFKPELAATLFDANVRGGFTAMMAAMDAVGSRLPLTVSDVTDLQYVAITQGGHTANAAEVFDPTLHDAAHSVSRYGVSALAEIYGDAHTEDMVRSLFNRQPKVALDMTKPLDQQPQAARALRQHIDAQFASVSLDAFAATVKGAFVRTGNHPARLKHEWSQSPRENAQRAEKILDANGLLTHLSNTDRAQVLSLIHGTNRPGTFEAAATRFAQSGNLDQFTRDVDAWSTELAARVKRLSVKHTMSRTEFKTHASRAIALGLLIERTAPGTLAQGAVNAELSSLPASLRELNLREAYLPVLAEVQRALEIAP